MQRPFEKFENECMQRMSTCKNILDVGGGTRFMKGMKKFESLFAQCDYKTLDVSADYRPDIVGDIHAIPMADASVDGVMCRSVLEHVERPADAVREIYRIVKPGGMVFIQVPSIYPYHARKGVGAYHDYWRFFDDTLQLICRDFSEVRIQKHGGWFLMIAHFSPLYTALRPMHDMFAHILDTVFRTDTKSNTHFYSVFLIK